MKHIKTYESWFTNLFKSGDSFTQPSKMSIDDMYGGGHNSLMVAAYEGNWKRFSTILPQYKDEINDIHTLYLDSGSQDDMNVMYYVIDGKGDLWEKKKMISALIENGIDIYFETNGKNFYEMIKDPELKKWVEETYPDVIEKLEINRAQKKYNL